LTLTLVSIVQLGSAQCGGHDHVKCPIFMSNGFCANSSRSLEFRQRICGRGCGLCLDDCHDSSKMCPMYARTGFCGNNNFAIETKRSLCMKTCFCNKRTTTTLPPPPPIDESLMTITDKGGSTGPIPVPVVPNEGPQPVVVIDESDKDNTGPQPVLVVPAPNPVPVPVTGSGKDNTGPKPVPVPVPVVPGPVPVPVIGSGKDTTGPQPVPQAGPVPVPDVTGSEPNPAPVPVPLVVPVVVGPRVLGSTVMPDADMLRPEGATKNTLQSPRPFTTCGLLKDDRNNEFFVVHEGVSMDLARHPFNDRATSILLLPECEMDLWEHVGQAGNMIRFHSSSEHTFKLDGPYRRAMSSLTCRC
ncbi:hypothetical protein PMAYCL1PPCAC_20190, partial [Pristionchus mayeri]